VDFCLVKSTHHFFPFTKERENKKKGSDLGRGGKQQDRKGTIFSLSREETLPALFSLSRVKDTKMKSVRKRTGIEGKKTTLPKENASPGKTLTIQGRGGANHGQKKAPS